MRPESGGGEIEEIEEIEIEESVMREGVTGTSIETTGTDAPTEFPVVPGLRRSFVSNVIQRMKPVIRLEAS